MKHLLRLLVFTCFFSVSYGQDMTAISETGTWLVYHSWPEMVWDPEAGTYVPVGFDEWMMYKTGGDTLIAGTAYKQLMTWGVDYDITTGIFTSQGGPGFPSLAYRNDNDRRAFRVMPGTTTEELWYDFNVQVGDTIEGVNQPAAFLPTTMYVTHIDTTTICDSVYNRYHYSNTPGQGIYDKHVIQRMGSTWNLIGQNWTTSEWFEVYFFCESPIELHEIVNVEEEELDEVLIYPNPASEILNINGLSEEQPYQIISMDGRIAQAGVTKAGINVQSLAPGRYHLHLPSTNIVSVFQKH